MKASLLDVFLCFLQREYSILILLTFLVWCASYAVFFQFWLRTKLAISQNDKGIEKLP